MFITAERMFDGRSGLIVEEPLIEVTDGRIVSVTQRRGSPTASDVRDLGDATLLPGLIDIHQHLGFDASEDPVAQLMNDDDAMLLHRMRVAATTALAGGITTVRDLGDRNYVSLVLRDRIRRGLEIGPEILASGPPITVSGGHCWFLGGETDGIQGVRDAVRERAAHGVDVIKIMATGGNMTPTLGPHESQFGEAELAAAVVEAHAHGLKIAAHAHGGQGIVDSMNAGVDSIEHCTFFTEDGVDADLAVIAELGRRRMVVSVTGGRLPNSGQHFPAMAKRLNAVRENHSRLHQAGARLVCGTDAGVAPNKPHDVLRYGISGFPTLGLTNAESLMANTSVAAEASGVGNRKGSIAFGMDADIIAVSGNPLDDIGCVEQVLAVFVKGRAIETSRS